VSLGDPVAQGTGHAACDALSLDRPEGVCFIIAKSADAVTPRGIIDRVWTRFDA
jgi:hypothetical protein